VAKVADVLSRWDGERFSNSTDWGARLGSPTGWRPVVEFLHVSDAQIRDERAYDPAQLRRFDTLLSSSIRAPLVEALDGVVLNAFLHSYLKQTAAYPDDAPPYFVVHTGDLIDISLVTELIDAYLALGSIAAEVPVYSLVGNHDGLTFGNLSDSRTTTWELGVGRKEFVLGSLLLSPSRAQVEGFGFGENELLKALATGKTSAAKRLPETSAALRRIERARAAFLATQGNAGRVAMSDASGARPQEAQSIPTVTASAPKLDGSTEAGAETTPATDPAEPPPEPGEPGEPGEKMASRDGGHHLDSIAEWNRIVSTPLAVKRLISVPKQEDNLEDLQLGYYDFVVGGVRFLCLDTALEQFLAKGGLSDIQAGWMYERLSEAARSAQPVVVFAHHSVADLKRHKKAVENMLARFPNVLAYLHGHGHDISMHERKTELGRHYYEIQAPSTTDYPQSAALVRIHQSANKEQYRIELSFVRPNTNPAMADGVILEAALYESWVTSFYEPNQITANMARHGQFGAIKARVNGQRRDPNQLDLVVTLGDSSSWAVPSHERVFGTKVSARIARARAELRD
jgi:3',5'-cyclic AMP phosphodiesterase CpdA